MLLPETRILTVITPRVLEVLLILFCTPPGTASNPLPPPAAASLPGLSPNDLLAYERQLAMSKMGSVHAALMHSQSQHPLKQAAAIGASQAIYDGGFQNVAAAQQMMYYQ